MQRVGSPVSVTGSTRTPLGVYLDDLVRALDTSYAELARLSGIPSNTLQAWKWRRRTPRPESLRPLARALARIEGRPEAEAEHLETMLTLLYADHPVTKHLATEGNTGLPRWVLDQPEALAFLAALDRLDDATRAALFDVLRDELDRRLSSPEVVRRALGHRRARVAAEARQRALESVGLTADHSASSDRRGP